VRREETATSLRQRAVARVNLKVPDGALPTSLEDLRRLLHELYVHQAELELQNEELVQARGELEVASEKYADLYDFAPVGYLTLDRAGVIRASNLRGASLLGVTRSTLPGNRLERFVRPEGRATLAAFIEAVFLGERPASCELPALGADDERRYLRVEGSLSDQGGECRLAVSDVTEQRRATDELARVEGEVRHAQIEAIGLLVGGLAHDLNNILTPIVAHAELAVGEVEVSSPAHDDLLQIRTAAGRAADLVQQLLVIGRRKKAGDLAPVDVGALAKETVTFLRASVPSTIDLRVHVDPGCGLVLADLSQIHQVLLNLCTNAAYAMSERGGVLAVTVEQAGEALGAPSLRLLVEDTGRGMSPALLARIFEPYFTTKPVGQGSGLGLAVVRGIVAELRGEITVRSKEGEGTTFEVLLPMMEASGSSP